MTLDRAIKLLEIERDYALKQRGFQQQPINKEIAEALNLRIDALKERQNQWLKE